MQMMVDGAVRGIDVEILSAVMEGAGLRPVFVKIPWARQLKLLEQGELDIAMSASVSDDRKAYADWTQTYRSEKSGLMKLASNSAAPKSLTELLGSKAKVGLIRGSEFGGEMAKLQADPRFNDLIVSTTSNQNNLDMLRKGRFPYVLEDQTTFLYLAQSQPGERVVEVLRISSDDVRFMVSKGTLKKHPELLQALDASLKKLKASKGIERIFARYGLKP
jgi:polar amino acid transport system substrate-binding protein